MGGHLFVVAGDITRLHCDAWLLPTDDQLNVVGDFAAAVASAGVAQPLAPWIDDEQRMRTLVDPADGDPQIWLGRVGRLEQPPGWYAECAERFVEAAAAPAHARRLTKRPVPLLATAVLGTRHGGGHWDEKGEILEALIAALTQAATTHDVDIALVTWGEDRHQAAAMYSAAHRARRRWCDAHPATSAWGQDSWPPNLDGAAEELAGHARSGRLVLFLGAGVSAGIGLPTWQDLIDDLADQSDLDEDSRADLHRLDLRDQATIVMRDAPDMRVNLAQSLSAAHYPLTGALLASLPTTEAITTNYDELFEAAVTAGKEDLAVLPYEAVTGLGQRWLLKLHGSIGADAGDIVLTRDDYLGAPSRHAALFGLVQAMLLTRHMLFVGYSLSDEDFHKIVHEVRTAQPTEPDGQREPLGSALVLAEDPLQALLWKDTIKVIPVGPRTTKPQANDPNGAEAVAVSARTLQIFLDRVAFLAADMSGFLLADGFVALLDDEERMLAEALGGLAQTLTSDSALGNKVQDVLRSFGGGPA